MKSKRFEVLRAAAVAAVILLVVGCKPEITSPTIVTAQVGQPFSYQIQATRNPTAFNAEVPPPEWLVVDIDSGEIAGTPTEAGTFRFGISASNESGTGRVDLVLTVVDGGGVSPSPRHEVVAGKELFITSPHVLGDSRAKPGGPWHFRSAMQRMAGGPGADVEAFALAWFKSWSVNGQPPNDRDPHLRPRSWVSTALEEAWAENRFVLIAIVNRIDLVRFPGNNADDAPLRLGEGRFVYEIVSREERREPFTVIMEFGLPSPSGDLKMENRRWARQWHALGRQDLGDSSHFAEDYMKELQAITDEFSAPGQLNQLRTNDFLQPEGGSVEWELREFRINPESGRLEQASVAVTPAMQHNNGPLLVDFINREEATILARGVEEIPLELQAMVAPVPFGFKWSAASANSPRATSILSFNTCNGCHAGDTGTRFQHVGVLAPDLSDFLRGEIALDHPLPGRTSNRHDEMAERAVLLAQFAGDVPSIRKAAFEPDEINSILESRANRPH